MRLRQMRRELAAIDPDIECGAGSFLTPALYKKRNAEWYRLHYDHRAKRLIYMGGSGNYARVYRTATSVTRPEAVEASRGFYRGKSKSEA